MTDHTPGTWHFVPTASMADCNEQGPVAGVFDNDDGEPGGLIGTADTDANARLMAAAPDLLEAATKFVETHRIASGRSCLCLFCQGFRAAIVKATGDSQ